jgi:hypothetical protein
MVLHPSTLKVIKGFEGSIVKGAFLKKFTFLKKISFEVRVDSLTTLFN